jgi:hypothetical protein
LEEYYLLRHCQSEGHEHLFFGTSFQRYHHIRGWHKLCLRCWKASCREKRKEIKRKFF